MRIALDAMGGDFAPGINVAGAIEAMRNDPSLEIQLVGRRDLLESQLAEAKDVPPGLTVVHAQDFIGMEEKPMEALRKKADCSITVCWKLLASKETDAIVSAGHTGGVVAAGLRTRLFLKGVKRPGIAVILPTISGQTVLMDVGANPGARPEHLHQYAAMGAIFSQTVLGVAEPRVGLMNIGSEEGKGTELVLETHELLMKQPCPGKYIGNVEGRGVYLGEADVIVCEGFVGNVVLKVSEGMASMMMKVTAGEVLKSLDAERDKAGAAFKRLQSRFEYNETGGAPLLGVDGICMICHGSSDARAIRNALKTTKKLHEAKVNDRITEVVGSWG
ncbi:MAG: phosphate acyltransferase PlsX [Planctomycetota bacterium]|nr:MAG: phosphate acyltransferase PlsX [Planctomycetota bacterium]